MLEVLVWETICVVFAIEERGWAERMRLRDWPIWNLSLVL